jgi:hypothetical protein
MGHEERFPPTRLSAGYGFRKETIAGVRHNGRDAPIADLPSVTPGGGASTQSDVQGGPRQPPGSMQYSPNRRIDRPGHRCMTAATTDIDEYPFGNAKRNFNVIVIPAKAEVQVSAVMPASRFRRNDD